MEKIKEDEKSNQAKQTKQTKKSLEKTYNRQTNEQKLSSKRTERLC
jgi:hypothetical protein